MRLLDLATLAYLAFSLVVLTVARPPYWIVLASTHVVTITLIVWRCFVVPSSRPHWFREWYPFLLIPIFYAEIPSLNHAFLSTARDEWVRSLEVAVFPSNPAGSFAAAAPWPALSETLHFSYLCYYPIIYGPLLMLYFQRRFEAFRATGFAVAATYYCCYTIFVLYPVRGPWDLWPLSGAQPDGPFRWLAVRILETGSSTGAAFPSSHQAVAVVQTLCAMRELPRLAPIIGVLSIGIGVGAVYASFHYAVEMIAGALFGLVIALGASWLLPQASGERAPQPGHTVCRRDTQRDRSKTSAPV
jgi:membrane-associated phospholipid phosphatase